MSRPVRVRVPATSANLGPGFDAFGLALTLYDELEVAVTGSGLRVEVDGEGADAVPRDESHLVVTALRAGLADLGAEVPGLALRCTNRIPHGRGLGSSAAAIVAGLAAAYGLAGTRPDPARLLELAAGLEGHPDNVAACILGGFTIAWTERSARAVRLDPHPDLEAYAYVPPVPLSTEVARGLLPDSVPHRDAAANAGRAALLATAVSSRPDLLLPATQDLLHQAYRAPAMPDTADLVDRLRADGVPAVVSGAGPTVLALLPGTGVNPAAAPDGWARHRLGIDPVGAVVWSGAESAPGE